jgi:hypothetical protein
VAIKKAALHPALGSAQWTNQNPTATPGIFALLHCRFFRLVQLIEGTGNGKLGLAEASDR